MATVFTQDAVLHFLQSSGGSVKNADLLLHFKNFIREHPDRDKNRELFKKFVNTVATVKQVDGVSYVVLRKTFKGNVPGGGGQRPRLWNPEGPAGNVTYSPAGAADKAMQNPPPGAVTVPTAGPSGKGVLPAAGIILNNVETNLKQKQVTNKPEVSVRSAAVAARVVSETLSMSEAPVQHQLTKVGQHRRSPGPPPDITPVVTAVRHHADLSLQVPVPGPQRGQTPGRATCQDSEGALHQYPPPDTVSPPPQVAALRRYRQSYKTAVSYDEDDGEAISPVRRRPAGAWPGSVPLGDMGKNISASSPSIINSPASSSLLSSSSSGRKSPEIYIHNVKGKKLPTPGLDQNSESELGRRGQRTELGLEPGSVPCEFHSNRRSLPLEAECSVPVHVREVVPHHSVQSGDTSPQPASVPLKPRLNPDHMQRTWLSSSQSSILTPSPDAGISSRGWNSSCEDLQAGPDKTGGDCRTGQPDRPLDNRGPTARVLPWHQSAGDLHDDHDEAQSSDTSIFSPPLRQHPTVARRFSNQLRNRMCRSLGADLDQLLQEDARAASLGGNEVARLNRLQLISSSLSLRHGLSSSSLSSCSTPPRCQSLGSLVEGTDRGRSLPAASPSKVHHEDRSRQSLVPLEPREHVWLVKGAAGAWPDIYSLFREDSSLLNRGDFISGFTVLHWIAKHGDHRVLNTLWYGVQKAGLTLDINARSMSGHTPLHVAAIHGHKNIIRLLVSKFNADVKLRDTAGKKAWQYLSHAAPSDIFQLLEAPPKAAWKGAGEVRKVDGEQQQRRRRRRHHFSTASSGQRPLTISGTTKVKRSSSLAAFLKHKSLHRFHGHQSDASI